MIDGTKWPYLEKVGLEIAIEKHIKAEYLEASTTAIVVHETTSVVLLQYSLGRYQRLDDDVIDFLPDLSDVETIVGQETVDRWYTSGGQAQTQKFCFPENWK